MPPYTVTITDAVAPGVPAVALYAGGGKHQFAKEHAAQQARILELDEATAQQLRQDGYKVEPAAEAKQAASLKTPPPSPGDAILFGAQPVKGGGEK